MEQVRKAVWFSGFSRVPAAPPAGPTADMLATLLEAEVEPALAREIATCVEARLAGDPLLKTEPDAPGDNQNGGQSERRKAVLIAELERRFNVDPLLGYPDSGPRIAAVVGPPGAGKTTTLAKLAVACGLRRNRSVQLLSLDTYRIASSEPLRTYAGILGAGLQALASPKAVDQAIKAAANKDLILIDTPGFGPRDMDAAAEIAARFSSLPEIQVHLVLPATLKSADLIRAVDRFDLFRPSRLLFTRVDETSTFGPAFSEAARTAKPVSYLAAGQQVPEDLQEATKQRIVELMLERFCE
jgi:flagellar biosynthesis protein FlhF